MILPVIMAGGNGSRLWPISRAMYPKQFLNVIGEFTMIQDTINRLNNFDIYDPLIVCNDEHRFLVAEQLNNIDTSCKVILEPEGRNTAPALALAALKAVEEGEDPLLLVLAADHVIKDTNAFKFVVKNSIELANEGFLVTFGIVPNSADTERRYIHRGEEYQKNFGGTESYHIRQFIENPNKLKAQDFLESNEYYWNSGMFLFKASRYIEELNKYAPEILNSCKESISNAKDELGFTHVDKELFNSCPSESIDYAVMEKTDAGIVVPLSAIWSNIDSWSNIMNLSETDNNGNYLQGDVLTYKSSNCLVHGKERLISVLGLEDVVIVDTKDALLVSHKNEVQNVKSIVGVLKKSSREECKRHLEVYRPWGKYESIDIGERYQVKRITVNPGAKLSVQMHHHRSEHWIIVHGTAKVTNGDKTFLVSENHSTYIPVGQIHTLENPGIIPLEFIEVQTGAYFGEDDIVRFEDVYGRS